MVGVTNAALFVALLMIRVESRPGVSEAGGSIAEAIRLAWRNPRLRIMLAAVAAVSIAADPVVTLSPAFAHQVFDRPGEDAGLIVAAFGIGSIAAALLFGRTFRASAEERARDLRPAMFRVA